MDLQFKTFPFEVKSDAPDGSSFEGLVSVFGNIDAYGEIVDSEAFDQDLDDFMRNGFIGGLNHNWDDPIGRPQKGTKVTDKGLLLKGNVIDTAHGLDVRKMLRAGIVQKLSIGFRTLGTKLLESEEEVDDYWKSKDYTPNTDDRARAQHGATVLTRIKLLEGSPVTVPANELAVITAVKAAREAAAKAYAEYGEPIEPTEPYNEIETPATLREFEAYLREAGLSRSKACEAIALAKTLLRDAVSDDADPAPHDPVIPGTDEADQPTPEPDATPESSETLPDGEQTDDGAAIVTQSEPAEITPEPPAPPEETREPTLVELEIEKKRKRLARTFTSGLLVLDAELAKIAHRDLRSQPLP